MGSGFDDMVSWHFSIITVNYNSSHFELLLSDLRLLSDECFMKTLSLPWTTSVSRMNPWSQVKVKITLRLTVCQSVRLGVESRLGLMTRRFFLIESYSSVHVWCPLWREVGSVICQSKSVVLVNCQYVQLLQVYRYYLILYTIYTSPLSVQAQYSRLCPISSSIRYNGSLVIWTVVCLTTANPWRISMAPYIG
jgi:hypothetical protein